MLEDLRYLPRDRACAKQNGSCGTLGASPGVRTAAESLLAGSEYEVDSLSVLKLVQDCDCSAYDCEFIALAQTLETKVVTMDAKLLKAFPEVAVPLAGNV